MPTQSLNKPSHAKRRKQTPRKERALLLRNAAVRLADAYGRPFEIQGHGMTIVHGRIFQIQYRNPSHKGWVTPPEVLAEAKQNGIPIRDWPFYIKVMTELETKPGRMTTVLSLDWDSNDEFNVCQFHSGEWEGLLQKFADDLPTPSLLH